MFLNYQQTKIEKFLGKILIWYKRLIYLYVKFEPDFFKIDGVMAIFVG